jgi:vitamin B12 transporter
LVESDSYLVTAYAQYRPSSDFTSRLTTGWTHIDYSYATDWGVSSTKNTRRVADWQNTWTPCKAAEIVVGADREFTENRVGPGNTNDNATGLYLSTLLKPVQDLSFTLGGRNDHFSTVGSANTWRTGAAYQFRQTGTTLRASYGTGFSAPSSDDRFGVPSWGMLPNAGLVPEKSRGWDLGIAQAFLEGKVTAELTYFNTRYRNLFEWETVDFTTYEGRTINRSRASTSGIEASIEARLNGTLTARFAYTYLDATDDISGARLTRRPRHVGDIEIRSHLTKAWIVGAGAHVVANRLEGAQPAEDYTTVRIFTSYDLGGGVRLKLRVENLLDEKYEEVYGYPALPLGVTAGVEWRF